MKNLIILLSFLILGCKEKSGRISKQAAKRPLLIVQVIDFTKSTDNDINYFDSTAAQEFYLNVAYRSKAIIKVIGVHSNSLNKEVFTLDVKGLDTAIPPTNVYQRNKAVLLNRQIKDEFTRQASENISRYIEATSKPHEEMYSDVSGALSLSQIALQQFQDYQKVLITYSDLKHEPLNKNDKLLPIEVNGATVICMRPVLTLDSINKLFKGAAAIHVVTSTQDINTLIQSL